MRIDSNTSHTTHQEAVPTLFQLREHAQRLKRELYATNRAYIETGDQALLTLQSELSIAYERALHQVRKRLQGRTDGSFGR